VGKPVEKSKPDTNGGWFDEYELGLQASIVAGCVMEEFRLVFASLGALGIISYLVYAALSEGAFNQWR